MATVMIDHFTLDIMVSNIPMQALNIRIQYSCADTIQLRGRFSFQVGEFPDQHNSR